MNPRVGKLRKCLVAWVAWKVIQTWTCDAKNVSFRFSANDAMPIPSSFSVGGVSGVSSVVFPFFVHPRKLTRNLPFQGSIFRFHVSFRGSNQYFVYLFVEFPELLDSSYVQQFSMFQVDKDNVTMKKTWISRFQINCSRYPIPILMNINSIQILWVNLHPNCQDFEALSQSPASIPSDPRIRWTRDCRGGSVCGALWPLSLGGEAGRWPPKTWRMYMGVS